MINDNKKNSFEGDYYGIAGKHFFLKLSSDYKQKKIKVAVASHTPLHRSLEGISYNLRKNLAKLEAFENADFIYTKNS